MSASVTCLPKVVRRCDIHKDWNGVQIFNTVPLKLQPCESVKDASVAGHRHRPEDAMR